MQIIRNAMILVVLFSPFIMLGISIIRLNKVKKKTMLDELEKKKKQEFALIKLIFWIIVSVIWGSFILYVILINADSSIDKSIIYLYPEEDTKISVKLEYNDKIIVSYPKYIRQK